MNTDKISSGQPSETCYKKILVAVDYLDSTPEIFNSALNLAKMNSADLMIFHSAQGEIPRMPEMLAYSGIGTYNNIYFTEMVEYEEQMITEATEQLQVWLDSFVQQAKEQGVNAKSDYNVGEPGQNITDMAKTWGADLIVVGRRGRRGLSELLLGSVSNYVIHHAPCSVLVVQ